MKRSVLSRAPVRICDIGGWTDTWFYKKNGAVFNFSIDLYSNVKLIENNTKKINIFSENLDLSTQITNYDKIEYDGTLDLLKAAIKRMEIKSGLDIYVRTDAPPGCGTGTSASVAVALISALAHYSDKPLKKYEIAELAQKLETEELKLESGVQDQFAAAYGGVNFMEIDYPSVKITNIEINEKRICELESQLILVYLSSRSSNVMHKAVIENYMRGQKDTIKSFEIMKNCAIGMKKAIRSADIRKIGDIMNRNWEAQKRLHTLMVNPKIELTEKIAFENGAIGFKCNGAGGGGSVIILARAGNVLSLKNKLKENGLAILPAKFNFEGVQTWETSKLNL
jgi:D-glycero-alpha-D-manno-heptose-7-phosphate kinase